MGHMSRTSQQLMYMVWQKVGQLFLAQGLVSELGVMHNDLTFS